MHQHPAFQRSVTWHCMRRSSRWVGGHSVRGFVAGSVSNAVVAVSLKPTSDPMFEVGYKLYAWQMEFLWLFTELWMLVRGEFRSVDKCGTHPSRLLYWLSVPFQDTAGCYGPPSILQLRLQPLSAEAAVFQDQVDHVVALTTTAKRNECCSTASVNLVLLEDETLAEAIPSGVKSWAVFETQNLL